MNPFEEYLPLHEIRIMRGYPCVMDYPRQELFGSYNFFWDYQDENTKNGFNFLCCRKAAQDSEGNCVFAVILKGIAYFDGVRHLWFSYNNNKDDNGYINYPDIENLELVFRKIKELELRHCRE